MNCRLPLRTRGRSFYSVKGKKVNQEESSRHIESTDAEAQATAVIMHPSVAPKDPCQRDCFVSLGGRAKEGFRPTSLINVGSGSTRTLVTSNPLPFSPPITVLIKNLTLEGNEWLEALKNLSINTGPTPHA